MKFFSVWWKVSGAIFAVGLLISQLYITMTRQTAEADKIASVFDVQQSRLEAIAKNFDQKVDQAILTAKSVAASYDSSTHTLFPIGYQVFYSQSIVSGIELVDDVTRRSIFRVESGPGVLGDVYANETTPTLGTVEIVPQAKGHFLILARQIGSLGEVQRLRIKLVIPENLPPVNSTGFVLMSDKGVVDTNATAANVNLLNLVDGIFGPDAEGRAVRTLGKFDYVVSSYPTRHGNLKFVALNEKMQAIEALNIPPGRRALYTLMGLCVAVLCGLSISNIVTRHHRQLAAVLGRLNKVHIRKTLNPKKYDDPSVVAQAMRTMGTQVQKLITEAKNTGRKEVEQKAVSLIQETLLPLNGYYAKGPVELAGRLSTTGEYGGDWWHFFQRGDDLFVAIADVAGKGTSSALMAAAARSAFSIIEKSDMTPEQMVDVWDQAISACSNGKIAVTALLLKIDTKTGKASIINASHNSPLMLRNIGNGNLSEDHVVLDASEPLGTGHSVTWKMKSFDFQAGDSIVLYTDGLFAVSDSQGRRLSERKFVRSLLENVDETSSSSQILSTVYDMVEDHRGHNQIPDDVAVVTIKWNGSEPLKA